MKRLLLTVLLLAVLCASAGCRAVMLSREYSRLLDQTAALSAETARRAEAGELTAGQMARALRAQARVWQRFKHARDGLDPDRANLSTGPHLPGGPWR